LSAGRAEEVMDEIMEGESTPSQIAAFLTALAIKGETVEEVAGFVCSMRGHALRVEPHHRPVMDVVGTGGDRLGTFNISTAAALVAAGSGVRVAKHGNRAASSECGSADLLEALGVKIDLGPEGVGRCIDEVGIGFMFAPRFHPAMKHASGPRKEIGIRTAFNLLGPLTNPAQAEVLLIGVYEPSLTERLAEVLKLLGTPRALLVFGEGMDELTTGGTNKITRLCEGNVDTFYLDPQDLGIPKVDISQLKGGKVAENVRIMNRLLEGERGEIRNVVLLNAGASLWIYDLASDIREGVSLASESLDSGRAGEKLARLVSLSQHVQTGAKDNPI
jgi:anthranilate phosphoribosyltransferase